jgi:membrane fusion protein, multidrug efflux system
VSSADIDQAAAAVAQAKADLNTARLNLGYVEICSPIDGYVGNRAPQVGAYVSPGPHLLTIVPAHGLWVDANFKEHLQLDPDGEYDRQFHQDRATGAGAHRSR